jgi:hypothetical protein
MKWFATVIPIGPRQSIQLMARARPLNREQQEPKGPRGQGSPPATREPDGGQRNYDAPVGNLGYDVLAL